MKWAVWGYSDLKELSSLYVFLNKKGAKYTKQALETALNFGAHQTNLHNTGWVVEVECDEKDLWERGLVNKSCAGWWPLEE